MYQAFNHTHPFVIKIPKIDNKNISIDNKTDNIIFSSYINYPLFALGYHSYIHRTRSAMAITKKPEYKTNFYYVVNPYESEISNYEDDIKTLTKKYFKYNKDISNEFLNIWEILFSFDIINKNKINASINNSELEDIFNLYKDKLNESYNFKTSTTMNNKNDFDLIISNEHITVEDENFIEHHFYKAFLTTIIKILKNQSENGNAVIKFYDSMTIVTLKLICLISSFYDDSLIYKPFISRQSDTERYLILKNFKASKNMNTLIKTLEDVIKLIDNNKNYISDIFPEMVLSKEFMGIFKFVNIKLVNNQQIMINEIIKYIKENNYFGDKYHIFRDKQIESTKWWITTFYPPSKNLYKKSEEDISKLYKTTQEKLNLECKKFIEIMI